MCLDCPQTRMRYFLDYMKHNRDDSPLYVFDSRFDEDRTAKVLLTDYSVPSYFPEDLFSLVGERRRPPYRWFLAGPARSGAANSCILHYKYRYLLICHVFHFRNMCSYRSVGHISMEHSSARPQAVGALSAIHPEIGIQNTIFLVFVMLSYCILNFLFCVYNR